jgi:ABC-type antimicrobial peptide transport system permease subunit
VGVSGAVRGGGPEQQPTEILYLPLTSAFGVTRASTLLVATSPGAEMSLAPALRALVGELDPDVPLTIVGTLEDQLSASMVRTSFTLFLLGIAALTALALGVVGLYGVVAYRVSARQGEIGIRMAVGAGRGQVRRLVLSHSLRLVGVGAAIGLAASLALSGLLESLLFGVRPGDPATIALATATLLVTATLAAWIPAQRATRIDPVDALRGE